MRPPEVSQFVAIFVDIQNIDDTFDSDRRFQSYQNLFLLIRGSSGDQGCAGLSKMTLPLVDVTNACCANSKRDLETLSLVTYPVDHPQLIFAVSYHLVQHASDVGV